MISMIMVSLLLACGGGAVKDVRPRAVRVDTVRPHGAAPASYLPGRVKAAAEATLAFKVAGRIAGVLVDEGDRVKKGDTLARLDDRDYRLQLAATVAEYLGARAEADRVVELCRRGSVAPNDRDKAVHGLQRLEAKRAAHRELLAGTRLVAPFDGHVQRRFRVAGETIGAGAPVMSLLSAAPPEVEVHVPASEYVRREEFAGFSCLVDALPGRAYSLELLGIARKANLNQLHAARLKMDEREAPLPAPGMTVTVEIRYRERASTRVAVPLGALFERDGGAAVWVYAAGRVAARGVTILELSRDGTAVVAGDLRAGEVVVTAGAHSLREGDRVRPLKPLSLTNAGGPW
jgi:RND family efflux transporter MFP subunit